MTEFKNYWVNEFAESNYVVNPCTVPHCMIIQYANGLIHHMIAYFGLTEHMNIHFWSNIKSKNTPTASQFDNFNFATGKSWCVACS